MTMFRAACATLVLTQFTAWAADPALLSLLMPDAKVMASIQVGQAKNSLFGQYVLSHMQPDDPGFQKFVKETGFDPARDLTEIAMASNWQDQNQGGWLIVARGSFDAGKIGRSAQQNGGAVSMFQGAELISGPGPSESAVAFLGNSTALMGDPDSVKAAIGRAHTNAAPPAIFLEKSAALSGKYDFWFVTLVPVSEFAGLMPDQTISQALNSNLFQAIQQASGGLKFGSSVQFSADVVTRSLEDATALVDVIRFIANMLQSNREKNPTAAQVSSLVDNMALKAAGTAMSMSVSIPESQLEQILENARAEKKRSAQHGASPGK